MTTASKLDGGEIVVETLADAERKLIAEVAFLNASRQDDRVRAYLDAWADRLQLPAEAVGILESARTDTTSQSVSDAAASIIAIAFGGFAADLGLQERLKKDAIIVCEAMDCLWP